MLATPIHVARQYVFVAPLGLAQPKGLYLQIFVWVGYFLKLNLKYVKDK